MDVEVVVVGAGHAGCEAAAAAARLGARTALITLHRAAVGRLSCNPAIGGLAKGALVREIDALGGLMARVTDATTLQFRRLNTRKGLAVQASRAQVDVALYPRAVAAALAAIPGLVLVEGEVAGVETRGGRVSAVRLADGTRLGCRAVVLTTGTFLGGVLHRGEDRAEGGRIGEGAAHRLSRSLTELGLRLGRLKTGTPPRIAADSVDWSRLERQEENAPGGRFSFAPAPPRPGRIACHLAWTTPETHALIASALHRSPMYTGAISGRGPRYCPSIEDKVVRFADKERHQLFLEPEGLGTDRVYLNGASTSLPAEVQEAFVRSVPGLERARFLQHGYAVEYDFADPRELGPDLQHRAVGGLYCAGQLNGTSGYEEAAAQGLLAGISAARGEPFVLERSAAYLGVLVDDLVSRGVGGEPYRMFPSRNEFRLTVREDNADLRLTPRGRALGLVDDDAWARFEARVEAIAGGRAAAESTRFGVAEGARLGVDLAAPATAADLLRRPEVEARALRPFVPGWEGIDDEALEQVEIGLKYAGYIERDAAKREQARRMEGVSLAGVDLAAVPHLSVEVRERLLAARPASLGAAARLPGVTPAAVDVLLSAVLRARRDEFPGPRAD